MRGDCITCSRLGICTDTNIQLVLESYTCPMYEPVYEEVFRARLEMMRRYGDKTAIEAMVEKSPHDEDGEH